MINELAKQIHKNNKAKGFYDEMPNIPTRLCLVHSEVSEALEADRKNSHSLEYATDILGIRENDLFKEQFEESIKDTFEDEIADSIIRLLDLAGEQKIDIQNHILAKVRYNTLRLYKHGKNY